MTPSAAPHAPVAVNPFLPLDEYIPDGEPHVFGDRVYLIGSHDSEDGTTYCQLDYVFYSAPVDDLSTWTSKGINYRAAQDPMYQQGRQYMFAPDVVQGNDGRFYLYYCMAGKKGNGGYKGPISVAVADAPDGVYEYHGAIRNTDGSTYDEYVLFDPAVINDEGVIRLYYGACYPFAQMPAITRPMTRVTQSILFGKSIKQIKARPAGIQGAIAIELEDDMLTVRGEPTRIIPEDTRGTSFAGHAFWEGSSIRKIGDTYYFVYSSFNSHELCYATSRHPNRDFVYRGTIVSNGNIGLDGRLPRDRTNHTGTNHGSIERVGGQWYVFYHRNTHGSIFRRQACAEPIHIDPDDGSISQVPVSSSGLHNGPLPADRTYPAVICSMLTNGRMPHGRIRSERPPRITHDSSDRYVGSVTDGTVVGFSSFDFRGRTRITLTVRGKGSGRFTLATDDRIVGQAATEQSADWTLTSAEVYLNGTHDLLLTYRGNGHVDLLAIALETVTDSSTDPHPAKRSS